MTMVSVRKYEELLKELKQIQEELKWWRSQDLIYREGINNYIKAEYVVGGDCPFPNDRCCEWKSEREDCRDCLIHHLEQIPKAEYRGENDDD